MSYKPRKDNRKPSRTNPLPETICTVPGYPDKLKVFMVECSRYWQARVYVNGSYRFGSLKTESKREALREAVKFYQRVLVDQKPATLGKTKSRSFAVIGSAFIESQNIPTKQRRYNDDRIRYSKELLPHFGERDIGEIGNAEISAFLKRVLDVGMTPATANHYLIVLRKILKFACDNRLIALVPNFPKVVGRQTLTKRDYFPIDEYKELVATIERLAQDGMKVRGVLVTLEFKYLVQFMVNSFIRPSDLRVLRHEHINVMVNDKAKKASDKRFLLLKHPATKTTDQEVVTMPAAYGIYQDLRSFQELRGYADPTDYLFFPEYQNRLTMIAVAGRIFSRVIKEAGLQKEGEKHTLYSLRHTSIMYRLLNGNASTLELARNARTSQAMIDKHYASRLTPLMAVDSIHSFKGASSPSNKKSVRKKS